ncbi:MAG TPA: trigger factor [Gaiellaceae bacterium]|jgi:trigger factor|nr:trigger factor [Gaiellaceae bacterium]
MEAQVERLEGDRVRLIVDVPASEVHHAVEHATHDLADRVKVPGFRAGKVPPAILVQRIGKQRLYSEAVESHISSWFWSAARTNGVRPSEFPEFDYELPTGDADGWQFKAEFPVQGPAEPADWTKLEVPRLEPEVGDEVVEAELRALQQIAATLSPVEGRLARDGDVGVIDIVTDTGTGQRDYVVEVGTARLVEEFDDAVRHLLVGDSQEVEWGPSDGERHTATISLKELYERVLPPLDDSLATATSEFDTYDELRADIVRHIGELLEKEAEAKFRVAAVDELLKASNVTPAELVVEVRTRDLLNAFVRQIESRGMDPVAYLRALGISGNQLEERFREEATQSIGTELLLEGVADKLGIEVSDDDIRSDLREDGESDEDIEEFMDAGGGDRVRSDLRLKRAVDRIAAEVTPISQELASARESIWTPGKEEGAPAEKKLWTPGDKE